ncbi:MAG: tetratricopeptide repeat protein [Candidatus Aminicenantes bacterium]|nr:tetratricopeptide repeat protein [Candidatus Aminicenantes bacterium]
MKPQTYKTAALAGLIILAFLLPAHGQARKEETLFQEAKILLFDEKWESALEKLEALLESGPSGPLAAQAKFYKARCLSRLDGREPEALAVFEDYLRSGDRNPNLAEEAEVTVIDLSYKLYRRGNRSYLRNVERRLESPSRVIRYYAAFKLSYAGDRAVAAKSLPILKNILSSEKDAELRDRAKIALLRVDPEALRHVPSREDRGEDPAPRLLRLEITEAGQTKIKVAIPWALADLAIQAIPDKEKHMLRRKGYDLERIMRELERSKSSIIEISEEEEKILIKLWID